MRKSLDLHKSETTMNEPLNKITELKEIDSKTGEMSKDIENKENGLAYDDDDVLEETILNAEAQKEFRTKKFWVLMSYSIVFLAFPSYLMNYFGTFCNKYHDANVATRFSPISIAASMIFRILFGLILDKYGAVVFVCIQLGLNILSALGLWFLSEN